MLKKWQTPEKDQSSMEETLLVVESEDSVNGENIAEWRNENISSELKMGNQLERKQREEVHELLRIFPEITSNKPGKTELTHHSISIVKEEKPIRQRPYRIPRAYQVQVEKELQEMLEQGIIEPSQSEWTSPIVVVKENDGDIRICIHYRKLNAVTKRDANPMPKIDDTLDELGQAKYITTLDLAKGYWQVAVNAQDQEKTAFSSPLGLFQFKRMPFGLSGAPGTFQRLMDRVINGLSLTKAYLDDLGGTIPYFPKI